jgi:hypothetical protein
VKLLAETTSSNPPKEVICQVGSTFRSSKIECCSSRCCCWVCLYSLVQLCCITGKFRTLCDPNF